MKKWISGEMETQEPMEILELKKFNRRLNSRREDQ